MEAVCYPDHIAHFSAVLTRIKLIYGITFGVGLVAGVAGSLLMFTARRLRGFIPGFQSVFTSMAFSVFRHDRKKTEV